MKTKLRFLAIFFIILFLLSSGIIAQSYTSGGYPSGDYNYGGYPSGGYNYGGYPSGGYNNGGYPSDYQTPEYPTPGPDYGYPDYDYGTAGPSNPPTYDYDQPAQWEDLEDVTINFDSPDNTIIYENLHNYCHDPDSTEIIRLASEHEHYTLELINDDLIIRDIEGGYTGTETVVLDCNSALGEFQLTLKRNIAPSADFTYTPQNPKTTDLIEFQDLSSDPDGHITRWSWTFGDGSTSTQRNPAHQYSQSGFYQVSLTVFDNNGGFNIMSKTVSVAGTKYPHVTPSSYQRTIFSRIRFNDYSMAGDIVGLKIGLFNDGSHDMEDMKITAHILDVEARRTAGPFDIDDGEEETASLYLDIPVDTPAGTYDLKITASNDDFKHIEYRTITIV